MSEYMKGRDDLESADERTLGFFDNTSEERQGGPSSYTSPRKKRRGSVSIAKYILR